MLGLNTNPLKKRNQFDYLEITPMFCVSLQNETIYLLERWLLEVILTKWEISVEAATSQKHRKTTENTE